MRKNAIVRHSAGLAFIGKANTNHWVAMDSSLDPQSPPAAAGPKELLLLAVGGCTGMDVVSILSKRRVPFRKFEVAISAEEAAEHPRVYTRIDLIYRFEADDLPVAELERAIRLSQDKYCSVSAMVRGAVPIHWTAEINGRQVLSGKDVPAGETRDR